MVSTKNKPPLDSEISVKEKYKSLSGKKKLEFIYDYYKFPIIGTLLAIIIIGYMAYSFATKQDIYCNITYYGSTVNSENFNQIKDKLNENILGNDKRSSIFTDTMLINFNSNYGDDPTTTQAFAVRLAANEIDILLAEKNNFEYFAANNMLLDLNSLEGFNTLNISSDNLATAKDESGTDKTYGIKVDNLNLLKDAGFDNEEIIKLLNEFIN